MDDDDADYMQGSDEEVSIFYCSAVIAHSEHSKQDFEYTDDASVDDGNENVDAENQYYIAKNKKENDPEAALKLFKSIVDMEKEKGEW
jgi:COP9 signalosome complex subunit 2